ncbi:hypothetical protein HDU90_003709 [Geranomyces variabilis]|nr:hypothetical protein HDU90_003709 [Geranomyces variabilis]
MATISSLPSPSSTSGPAPNPASESWPARDHSSPVPPAFAADHLATLNDPQIQAILNDIIVNVAGAKDKRSALALIEQVVIRAKADLSTRAEPTREQAQLAEQERIARLLDKFEKNLPSDYERRIRNNPSFFGPAEDYDEDSDDESDGDDGAGLPPVAGNSGSLPDLDEGFLLSDAVKRAAVGPEHQSLEYILQQRHLSHSKLFHKFGLVFAYPSGAKFRRSKVQKRLL